MQRREIAPWIPMAILIIATLIVFFRLVMGDILFWGLPSLQFYPWRQFAFNELQQGRIPFWNPYVGGGTPLIANYQSAILYPPNWLHLLFDSAHALSLIALFHILWAGVGMSLFTRSMGFSDLGRGTALLSFAMGTYALGHLGDLALLSTMAWLPWLFWATLGVLESRQLRYVGLLGLFAGLQLLAGHLQTSWYSFIAIGLFAVWVIVWRLGPLGRREQWSGFVLVCLGIALGAGIASTQLVLTFELLLQSQRVGGVGFDKLAQDSFAPWRLITVVMPRFFGTPQDGSYLLTPADDTYVVIRPYIGIVPLLGVWFAVRGWQRRRSILTRLDIVQPVPFWIFLSITGVILAFGRYTPLYRILYDTVPTFDGFRTPSRWLIWPAFGLAMLAGIGIHNWPTSPRFRALNRIAIPGVILVVLAVVGGLAYSDTESRVATPVTTAVIMLGVWLVFGLALSLLKPLETQTGGSKRWKIAVLVLIAFDLGWSTHGLTPTGPGEFYERDYSVSDTQGRLYWYEDHEIETRTGEYFDLTDYRPAVDNWPEVRTSLLPNLNMVDRVATFNNFDPLQPAPHRRYVELIEENSSNLARILGGAGIGEVYGETPPPGWIGEDQQYLAPFVPPSVWLVNNVRWVADYDDALRFLRSPGWHPRVTAVLETESSEDYRGYLPYPTFTEARLEIVTELPGERQYRVQSDGTAYLIIANTWYPGWTARINGQQVKIHRANVSFQAIEVPPGDTTIELTYRPTGLALGLALSILSLFAAVVLIAVDWFQSGY